MAPTKLDLKKFPIRMDGEYKGEELILLRAVVDEGFSQLSKTTLEFAASNKAVELNKIVGSEISVVMDPPGTQKRDFVGTCVSAQYLGTSGGYAHFTAEVRPWLWFLTRSRNCRIFQDKSVVNIIDDILGDYGFSGNLDKKLTATYTSREYCVQYRETDLDFLLRLMEEEGIFYFFANETGRLKLVLADSESAYTSIAAPAKVGFLDLGTASNRPFEYVDSWAETESVTTGKVTLNDYNFETPKADLKSSKATPKGSHSQKNHEIYDYPGHFRKSTEGDRYARINMEAEAVRHKSYRGAGNITRLAVGQKFELTEPPRKMPDNKFVVTQATHYLQLDVALMDELGIGRIFSRDLEFDNDSKDNYRIEFTALPEKEQYRAAIKTPWPEISGIHTAIVVGPRGEEIYTDKYGRVKVQFHWDRLGQSDDKSSCFVRTMMPWTGKGWGAIAIPRIGQEVVVQFEEGNPDRPVVVGMLYNADTMPPFALPANMSQTGLKTNSTKGGGGYSELVFEDKKDDEFVSLRSERDYKEVIKNDAVITIGLEHRNKGDLTQTIHRNKTETLNTGDHTLWVKEGSQKINIAKDQKVDIKRDQTIDIANNKQETIEGKSDLILTGNLTETVKTGNVKRTVKSGNETTTLNQGNYTLKTSMGKVSITAMQSITLEVGGSSIKIDASGVTIKGPMIKIQANGMIEAKAPMTTVKGDGMLILKGGLTMIN